MTVKSRPYCHKEDYDRISKFLIKHYLPGNADGNWLEATWEYANFHPALDHDNKDRWQIWEDGDEIVAFAHYESRLGEGFFEFHPGNRHLREEMLDYAEGHLEGIRRCALLGATEAFVGSEQLFYQSIGFKKGYNTEGWKKYFE